MPSTAEMIAAVERALAKGTQGPFAWREEIIADVGGENIRCGYWFLYGGDKLILSDGSACGEYCQDIDPQGQDARLLCALLNAAPWIVADCATARHGYSYVVSVKGIIERMYAALVATGATEACDE
jgi:hypothetical protein